MAIISEDKISEVSRTADIFEIISESVRLRKTGKNFVGLCPFHSEKTPSFSVSPDKQMFYCFGCGAGGNVFHFLMKQEGVSFPEAVRMLAARYGIEINERNLSPAEKKKISERESLLNLNQLALDYFRSALSQGSAGEKAGAYLAKRGITLDIIDDFQLGYVPAGWDNLLRYFSKRGVSRSLAERSGLIVESQKYKGRFYDRFRNRIIFPIFNISQQLIGFGGRVLDDSLPKYLNSPETPVYNKRRSLYGLHKARPLCRASDTVYIVEGYFDLLALCQHGIKNVVATLGTALSPEHVRLLKGVARTMVLVYDSDMAGIKAALRCVDIFLNDFPIKTETVEKRMDPRILVLPQGYDPDAYIFEFGAEAFLEAAKVAPKLMSFLIETAVKKHGLSIDGKLSIIAELQEPLSVIRDDFARSLYVKELAERTGIEELAILEKISEYASRKRNALRSDYRTGTSRPQIERKRLAAVKPASISAAGPDRMEMRIIAMMLQFPEILPELKRRNIFQYIENPDLKSIAQLILNRLKDSYDKSCDMCLADLVAAVDDAGHRQLISSLALEEEAWVFEGCLKLLKQFVANRNRSKDDLIHKIKAAEESNDQELLLKLLREKQVRARKSNNKLVEPAGGKTL